jgi:carbamoyl-phosphate synthase large subunit
MFVKPRYGSASKAARQVLSAAQLEAHREEFGDQDLLQQQLCSGPEFTVDCFATDAGIHASPRIRLEVLGGEAIKTQTVSQPVLVEYSKAFIRAHDLKGPLTLQFMECNPRFGGGVLCSIKRGYDFPALIVAVSKRQAVPELAIGSHVLMSRYFAETYFDVGESPPSRR